MLKSDILSYSFGGEKTGLHRQSNFAPAFLFLRQPRRKALESLYAVCRLLDDAVDVGRDQPAAYLKAWKEAFQQRNPAFLEPYGDVGLAQEFLDYAENLQIPLKAMEDLIDRGVSVDLNPRRFQTPLDLEDYCYGVAGTVGLACLPIFGVPVDEAKNFAIRLGIAIQWINTLRDVGADAKMGRIYLPLDHLEQFGYTEADLFARKNTSNFQSLMTYECGVARAHYSRALELMPQKWKTQLLPARIMGRIYLDLLNKLEKNNFPVFSTKVRLNWLEKILATIRTFRE